VSLRHANAYRPLKTSSQLGKPLKVGTLRKQAERVGERLRPELTRQAVGKSESPCPISECAMLARLKQLDLALKSLSASWSAKEKREGELKILTSI
jgi:hypothetical protein